MSGRSIFIGERAGARVFKLGRLGYDAGGSDLSSQVFIGTFRTERIAPAGPAGLINFRRVEIHVNVPAASYEYTVKVYVDNVQTVLGTGVSETVVINRTAAVAGEYTDEVAVQAVGNHIQVEITVDSNDVTTPFMIESITAHGRVLRGTNSRAGETA